MSDSEYGRALLTGAIAGLLSRAQAEGNVIPIKIEKVNIPSDEYGNYLSYVEVKLPSGWYRVQVAPAPAIIEEEP